VCAYPNAAAGCGDWRFFSTGEVQGLTGGNPVWTGRWDRVRHYVYHYEFPYMGLDNNTWVVFSDPSGAGHATELMAYPDAAMTAPYRKGELAAH
jgi:hypothetical protein